jgi:hypothetical protein
LREKLKAARFSQKKHSLFSIYRTVFNRFSFKIQILNKNDKLADIFDLSLGFSDLSPSFLGFHNFFKKIKSNRLIFGEPTKLI